MKPIRLAFSGAGFKIPAHAGALQAVIDAGYEPVEIIGTSAGSIIGALYACGMPLADMKTLALTHDWADMMSWTPFSAFKLGFCNGNNLLAFLSEKTGGKTFGQLPIRFSAVTSDLTNNTRFIFSKDNAADVPVALAVRASASLPFVFEPVTCLDRIHQDGGMASNIAADSLVMDDVPRLGIQLVSNDTPLLPGARLSLLTLGMRIIDLMLSACESAHVSAAQAAGAKMVFVDTSYASTLARNMPLATRQKLFNDGYKATAAALAKMAVPA
jgi:NTE family protein